MMSTDGPAEGRWSRVFEIAFAGDVLDAIFVSLK
jgi:hypothetical protein